MHEGTRSVGVVGVGYQQRPVDEFVSDLARMGVAVVVDVRLTPISRRPGFSKTGLARALAGAGICYEHRPELGNPKPNRAGFAGSAGRGATRSLQAGASMSHCAPALPDPTLRRDGGGVEMGSVGLRIGILNRGTAVPEQSTRIRLL